MRPYIGPEDVDDHIHIIHEDPLRGQGAFDAERMDALSGEGAVDMFRDRAGLTVGFPGAEHQIIGNGGQLGDIEDDDVNGFLFECCLGDG